MVYEDFTTYTEVDIVADRIQKTAQHIDHVAVRNETTYLYKDKGAGYFGDFTHLIDVRTASHVGNTSLAFTWMLSNTISEAKGQEIVTNKHLGVYLYDSGEPQLKLNVLYWDGSSSATDSYAAAESTWYFLVLKRVGTSFTCEIYDNAERSGAPLATLSLTVTADTFQYIYGCASYNTDLNAWVTTDINNLEFVVETAPTESLVITRDIHIGGL